MAEEAINGPDAVAAEARKTERDSRRMANGEGPPWRSG